MHTQIFKNTCINFKLNFDIYIHIVLYLIRIKIYSSKTNSITICVITHLNCANAIKWKIKIK